jgi:hypothetical protein
MKPTRKRKKSRKGGTVKETVSKGFYSTVSAIGTTAKFVGKAATTTAGVVERVGKKMVVGTVETALLLKIKPAIKQSIPEVQAHVKELQQWLESNIQQFCKKYPKPYCDKLIQCSQRSFDFLNDCLYHEYILSITTWNPIFSELWKVYQMMPEIDRQQWIEALQENEPDRVKPKGMWNSFPQVQLPYLPQGSVNPFFHAEKSRDPIYGETIKQVLKMMSPKFKVTMLENIISMILHLPSGNMIKFPLLAEMANSVGSAFIFMLLKQYVDDINTLSPSVLPTGDDELKKQIYDLLDMFFKMGIMIFVGLQTTSPTLEMDIKQALNDMVKQVETIQLGNPKALYLQQICEIIDLIDTTDRF